MSERLLETNDQLPHIKAYFQFTEFVSNTEVPDWVENQQIGLFVLLRYEIPAEGPNPLTGRGIISRDSGGVSDGVKIYGSDLIDALENIDRNEAAEWWRNNMKSTMLGIPKTFGRFISVEGKQRFYPD